MYPRRIKDLPRFEIDSDDEYNTPHKQNNNPETLLHQDQKCDKENKETNNSINNSGTFSKLRMYPKRRSELPILESDSEEDDNLNCAILNDSFIMSPTKSEHNDSGSASFNALKENHPNKVKHGDLSFLKRFNEMAVSADINVLSADKSAEINKKESVKTREPKGSAAKQSNTYCNVKINNELQSNGISAECQTSIANNKSTQVKRYNSDPISQQQQSAREDLETPYKSAATSSAIVEAQFVTPQVSVRTFSVQRRPQNDLCSTQGQSQKSRTAIDNEFRSQKVLFQTPMTIARTCLPNESITLSLCDTINEQATPNTNETAPQIVCGNSESKSKKSLEVVFNELEQDIAIEPTPSSAIKSTSTTSSSTSLFSDSLVAKEYSVSTTASNEEILEINNGKYAIIKKLGAGGSSSVYLAQRKDNGRECALKVVDLRGDAAVVEGYLNETKLLAKLQGNPCVVSLYEYELIQKESKLYLVMEKGDSDLNKILQNYKTNIPLYVLMNYWYQMLQAVNYIHQNGVIHSDLKPANFLMVNGRLKLIDFGIASNIALDSTSIIKFSQAGTFNYISPEALTDTSTGSSPMRNQPKIKISTKSDVWSLGCILYLLLYKRTPFSHILNIYAKISAISSPSHAIDYPAIPFYYPSMLVHMAKKCLQHNAKERPSCAELLRYPFSMVIPIQNLTVPQK